MKSKITNYQSKGGWQNNNSNKLKCQQPLQIKKYLLSILIHKEMPQQG